MVSDMDWNRCPLSSESAPLTLADGNLVDLREVARRRPLREFVNRLLGEILTARDVDRFEPALFAPAPGRAGRHPDLLKPPGEADDRTGSQGD